jgi:putative ABC transport system permease protein
MATEDHKALGESPTEARYRALRQLGNLTRIKENVRAVWRENSMELLWQDLRIAVRGLMKSPIFTGTAVALIALGIGVNGSVFSVFHSIVQRPMSGVTARNLVSLGVAIDGREDDPGNTWTNYLAYKESSKAFRRLTARCFERFTLGMESASYALRGGLVTPDYFDTLGVRLAVGRSFTSEEGNPEAGGLVAVISHQLWREQFEGAQDIVGRQVLLNGHAATVIGVAPPKFRGIQLGEQNDVWVPIVSYSRLHHRERVLNDPANRFIEIVGQLADGVTLAEAQAELNVISKRLEETYPDQNRRFRALVAPYTAIGLGLQSLRFVLKLLLMFAGLFLMVICANVANLILSRSLERQHEMAVRKSLGAPLSRLVSLLLAEGFAMSILAALVGWGVATWATPIIVSLSPGAPPSLDLSPDATVAMYALLQAIIATLVFTTLPALRIWRQDPFSSLKSRQATISSSGKRLLTVLTVMQLTACVVLLSGAGLLLRSSSMLDDFDTGFKRQGLLFLSVDTAGAAKDSATNARLLGELWNRLRLLPGIQAVSYAAYAPLAWQSMSLGLVKGDVSTEPARVDFNVVGPGYLTALGTPMRLGRDISDTDRKFSARVAVVNENMAQALWPGQNPLGRTIEVPAGERLEVVGVVANGSFSDIRQGAKPNMVFVSFAQQPQEAGGVAFHVRHSQPLQSLMPSIRASIHQQNSQVAIVGSVAAEQRLRESMPLQFLSVLITVFAALALLVAGIGLYGLVALNMTRRTREFAVRIALGATSPQIWLEALRGGMILTGLGLGAGLLFSVLGSQALRSVLFGVSPTDAVTYASVTAVLTLTCVAACLVPARRATRVDPAMILREE